MVSRRKTRTACFDAYELYMLGVSEVIKDTNGIAASADTGNHHIWQAPLLSKYLFASFFPDDRLKITHDTWIGMRANNRANQIKSCFTVRYPVPDCFIDSIFKGTTPTGYGAYFCP